MGTFRFFLATCVVVFHLTGSVPNIGLFAVNGFYVVSGFLMALVINENYKFGFPRFAMNRVLRLFPDYFAAVAIGLCAFAIIPSFRDFHPSWSGQINASGIAGNLFVLPWAVLSDQTVHVTPSIPDMFYFRVISQSWSVGVELACYLLVFLIGARTVAGALTLTLIGVGWHIGTFIFGAIPTMRYGPVPAASLAFGLGCLAYFISRSARLRVPMAASVALAILAFLVNWLLSRGVSEIFSSPAFYLNTLIAFSAALLINRQRFAGRYQKLDKELGDLAYPLFLLHYVCALIGHAVFIPEAPIRGWAVFAIGYPITVAASYALISLVDRPLESVRARVRASNQGRVSRLATLSRSAFTSASSSGTNLE